MFFVGFMFVWSVFFFGALIGMVLGVIALISAARTPAPAFGPWWDNTKTTWLLGIAISYMIPFGLWVTSIYWFRTGRRGLTDTGLVGRPFWTGPPKPYPPTPPPGYQFPPAAPMPAPAPTWDPTGPPLPRPPEHPS